MTDGVEQRRPNADGHPAEVRSAEVHSATVVGAAGAVATLFGQQLSAAGVQVTGVDLRPSPEDPADPLPWGSFLRVDVTAPVSEELREVLGTTDLLIVALPEAVGFAALDRIVPELPAGALLTDVFAVKAPMAEWLQTARSDLEVLSLQPLFAPDLGFAGQNVAAVEFAPGPRSGWLLERLGEWGARVTRVDADTHDGLCAINQVAVHTALLAYGLALETLGGDAKDLSDLSTPQSRALLAGVSRIAELNPEGYWAIQAGNPAGPAARAAVLQGVQRLMAWVDEGDDDGFTEALVSLRRHLALFGSDRTDQVD